MTGVVDSAPPARAPNAAPVEDAGQATLWDVVAEHLDEAAYAVESLGNCQRHPLFVLEDQATWGEARLEAHVDGLVVGGAVVAERTLLPALADPDPEEPERVTAATLALLCGGRENDALAWTELDDSAIRAAGALAFRWSDNSHQRALARLASQRTPTERAGLLAVCAASRVDVPDLAAHLRSRDPGVAAAAAPLALFSTGPGVSSALEYLVDSDDAACATAAVVPALARGSRVALARLHKLTLDSADPDPHLMALYAAVGPAASHAAIAERARASDGNQAALFALGYTGSVEHAELLLGTLGGSDPLAAALAAQSLSLLFGIDLRDETLFLPPAAPGEGGSVEDADEETDEALPSFEDDDLDASLLPLPEQALDAPQHEAFAAQVEARGKDLERQRSHLLGRPLSAPVLVHALGHATLRTRHVLADVLSVLTAGKHHIDTRALAAQQQQQLHGLGDPGLINLERRPGRL